MSVQSASFPCLSFSFVVCRHTQRFFLLSVYSVLSPSLCRLLCPLSLLLLLLLLLRYGQVFFLRVFFCFPCPFLCSSSSSSCWVEVTGFFFIIRVRAPLFYPSFRLRRRFLVRAQLLRGITRNGWMRSSVLSGVGGVTRVERPLQKKRRSSTYRQ